MLETLLNKVEALSNERGSAAVLREHLGLLRERIVALERENADLRAKAQQAQAHVQHQGDQLRRFEDERFPQLLSQLDQLARPATSAPSSTPTKHLVTEPAVTSAIGTSPSTARPAA